MNKLKTLRSDQVDRSLKESFGIKLGTKDLMAKLVAIRGEIGQRQEFIYNIFIGDKMTTRVSVSTNENGVQVGSNNGDIDINQEGYRFFSTDKFYIAHGDWAYLDPFKDHEVK